jgi:hypothetical protein
MKQKERAQVSIYPTPLEAFAEDVEYQKIEFCIENFGATFAKQIRVTVNCEISSPSQPIDGNRLDEYERGGKDDVAWIPVSDSRSKTPVIFPVFWYPNASEVQRIRNVTIAFKGTVDYDDIFGDHHFFRFRYSFHILSFGPVNLHSLPLRFPIISVAKWRGNQEPEEENPN